MTQLLRGARAFLFLFLAGGTSAQADTLQGWVGTWRNGDNRISMSLRNAELFADGEAYYPAKITIPFPMRVNSKEAAHSETAASPSVITMMAN
jgi:hypothetical protein